MLSLNQIKDVCLGFDGSSKKCRYFSQDNNDYNKYYCLKLTDKNQKLIVMLIIFYKN